MTARFGVARPVWWVVAGRLRGAALATLQSATLGAPDAVGAGTFSLFESGQVRPLALTPNGQVLLAYNTPDGRLELFAIGEGTPTPTGSAVVGLAPRFRCDRALASRSPVCRSGCRLLTRLTTKG